MRKIFLSCFIVIISFISLSYGQDGMVSDPKCISGDCQNGQGTMEYYDGSKYVGQFKDNEMNGQGTKTWPDGKKYVGQFKDGKKNGQGTETFVDGPNGQKYVGQWEDDLPNGQGTYTYHDGSQYVGQWKHGRKVELQKKTLQDELQLVSSKLTNDFRYITGIVKNSGSTTYRLVSIRYYGILSHRNKKRAVEACRDFFEIVKKNEKIPDTWMEIYLCVTVKNISCCPVCKKGVMKVKEIITPLRYRAPPCCGRVSEKYISA